MGIPYSRQINAAFDQVTPLVAQGFSVLETTKNIAILLAWIEVLTIVLLSLILTALIALLVTMNPDLARERKLFVTPVLKWIMNQGALFAAATAGLLLFAGMISGLYLAIHGRRVDAEAVGEAMEKEEEEKNAKNGDANGRKKSG